MEVDFTREEVNLRGHRATSIALKVVSNYVRCLVLDGNPLESYDFLARLPRLQRLSLRGNGLRSFRALAALPPDNGLEELDVAENRIADFAAVPRMNRLQRLDVSGNEFARGVRTTGVRLPALRWAGLARSGLNELETLLGLFVQRDRPTADIYFFMARQDAPHLALLDTADGQPPAALTAAVRDGSLVVGPAGAPVRGVVRCYTIAGGTVALDTEGSLRAPHAVPVPAAAADRLALVVETGSRLAVALVGDGRLLDVVDEVVYGDPVGAAALRELGRTVVRTAAGGRPRGQLSSYAPCVGDTLSFRGPAANVYASEEDAAAIMRRARAVYRAATGVRPSGAQVQQALMRGLRAANRVGEFDAQSGTLQVELNGRYAASLELIFRTLAPAPYQVSRSDAGHFLLAAHGGHSGLFQVTEHPVRQDTAQSVLHPPIVIRFDSYGPYIEAGVNEKNLPAGERVVEVAILANGSVVQSVSDGTVHHAPVPRCRYQARLTTTGGVYYSCTLTPSDLVTQV